MECEKSMTQTSPSFSRVLDLFHKLIHNGLVVWVRSIQLLPFHLKFC